MRPLTRRRARFRITYDKKPWLRNPYARAPKRNPWKAIVIVGGGVGSLGFFLYLLFFSPLFSVQQIEVEGAGPQRKDAIVSMVRDSVRSTVLPGNMLAVRPQTIIRRLDEAFFLREVSVEREFPHTIRVRAKEREPAFLLLTPDLPHLVDETGMVLANLTLEEAAALALEPLPTVVASSTEAIVRATSTPPADLEAQSQLRYALLVLADSPKLAPRDQALPEESISRIQAFLCELESTHHVAVTGFLLNKPESAHVIFHTQEGWEIRAAIGDEQKRQLENLGAVLRAVGERRSRLEYVDLRFGDRVFYK